MTTTWTSHTSEVLMPSPLSQAIVELAAAAGDSGISMGAIVDALDGRGFAAEQVEHEIWLLLAARLLTPCGYVCRTIKRRDDAGQAVRARMYEFLLVPWSPSLDQQLELALER